MSARTRDMETDLSRRADGKAESSISVDEIVKTFRSTLISLVPVYEKLHIPWRNEQAYDEWDEVAAVLFKVLVAETIREGTAKDLWQGLGLAEYDMEIEDYSGVGFIEVRGHDSKAQGVLALGRFVTEDGCLDVVECAVLSPELVHIGQVSLKAFDARFAVRLPSISHGVDSVSLGRSG